ncbi:helix-turn-helix domain-containing protein [Streptomyces sp. B1866]|uniref:IclR family transcriptional regulator n=1 Tax=Streptomyces sp. B1866 TaxID=3075431 RepID=UPI002891F82B|nr:helix-turn-helix domain-containing protein [Streptomyces sp. B1866]MDT3396264.1 helix-turn-helix domain-containing protein [Streptomyces sp. B1866]
MNLNASCEPTLISSVQRALRLLEAVASHPGGAPAKQLAREAKLPLPTAYHLLRTLAHEGYLRREDGVFVLGEAARRLSGAESLASRRAGVSDTLAAVSGDLGVDVCFSAYRDGEVEVLAGAGELATDPAAFPDMRSTAHAHAMGQCLLGQLGDEEREDHLSRHPAFSLTRYSVRDADDLRWRLAVRRPAEPVYEYQEFALGYACAAFPVPGIPGAPAAVAITGLADDAQRLRSVVETLRARLRPVISSLTLSISI